MMNIRETFNRQSPTVQGAVIGTIVLLVAVSLWASSRSGRPANANEAYYTADDGLTTFADDFFRGYPFDYGGRPAYRAYVYQTSSGKRFVAYLERYTPEGLVQLQELLKQNLNRDQLRQAIQDVRARYTEVKKPNDPGAKWYAAGTPAAQAVERITPPTPSGDNCILVFP